MAKPQPPIQNSRDIVYKIVKFGMCIRMGVLFSMARYAAIAAQNLIIPAPLMPAGMKIVVCIVILILSMMYVLAKYSLASTTIMCGLTFVCFIGCFAIHWKNAGRYVLMNPLDFGKMKAQLATLGKDGAKKFAKTAAKKVVAKANVAAKKIVTKAKTAAKNIVTTAKTAAKSAKKNVTNVKKRAMSAVNNGKNSIGNMANNMQNQFNNMQNNVGNMMNNAQGQFNNMQNNVGNMANMAQGQFNNMQNNVGNMQNWAGNIPWRPGNMMGAPQYLHPQQQPQYLHPQYQQQYLRPQQQPQYQQQYPHMVTGMFR